MLDRERIERLRAFDGRSAGVLSAYLDLDPARRVRGAYRAAFDGLVRAAGERVPESLRDQLQREAGRVCDWLDRQEPPGTGLAVFSCEPAGLWQAEPLFVPVRDHLAFEPRADLGPLLELLDEYERYAVALVDKRHARLFTVFLGQIEGLARLEDHSVPGRTDAGGLSQSRVQRHHEAHVYWHLKRVAQHLAELLVQRRFDRLVLAGPEEVTAELRRVLPRAVAHRVVAEIRAHPAAGEQELLKETLAIERGVEREAEERLLRDLLDASGPAGRAAVGVGPTLDALWADLVQTLLVAHGAGGSGSECPNCGRLAPGAVATCPTCGKAMQPLHDVVHRAMAVAVEQAGRVEVLHGAAARRLVEAGEGLAAFLRYRWAARQAAAGA
jgi:peptide chain release factor subunit 1